LIYAKNKQEQNNIIFQLILYFDKDQCIKLKCSNLTIMNT
jgi:hypothetical protein